MILSKPPAVDPRLETITPDQLRQYVLALGMKPRPSGMPKVDAFVGPTDDYGTELLIYFPQSQQAPDYVYAVNFLLRTLSGWERRSESEIVTDILKLPKTADAR